CLGIGGCFASESPAGFNRNTRLLCVGTRNQVCFLPLTPLPHQAAPGNDAEVSIRYSGNNPLLDNLLDTPQRSARNARLEIAKHLVTSRRATCLRNLAGLE